MPPTTPDSQSWTEAERLEIQEYARQHPAEGWRKIKAWYMSQHPGKSLSHSQISKILRAAGPRQPSDTENRTELDKDWHEWLQVLWQKPLFLYLILCLLYVGFYSAEFRVDLGWVRAVDTWIILFAICLITHLLLLLLL